MNIKPIIETALHSTAFKYWVLLIPVKSFGSWTFLGALRIFLAKKASNIDLYIKNNAITKLASQAPQNTIYLMYYILVAYEYLNNA